MCCATDVGCMIYLVCAGDVMYVVIMIRVKSMISWQYAMCKEHVQLCRLCSRASKYADICRFALHSNKWASLGATKHQLVVELTGLHGGQALRMV